MSDGAVICVMIVIGISIGCFFVFLREMLGIRT